MGTTLRRRAQVFTIGAKEDGRAEPVFVHFQDPELPVNPHTVGAYDPSVHEPEL